MDKNGNISIGERHDRTFRLRNAILASSFNLENKRVLDIGCAEGLHSLYMATKAKEVIGIDHRKLVIDRANLNKEHLGIDNVHFINGDLREQKTIEHLGKFDLIVAWGLLHRVADPISFLHSISNLGNAYSFEWRTLVIPFMSTLSIAAHAYTEKLDETNLNISQDYSTTGNNDIDVKKHEGHSGFWDLTPGAVKVMMRRVGFNSSKIIGYDETFRSEFSTVILRTAAKIRNILVDKRNYQLPHSRVHMFFYKEALSGIIPSELKNGHLNIPSWDIGIRQRYPNINWTKQTA